MLPLMGINSHIIPYSLFRNTAYLAILYIILKMINHLLWCTVRLNHIQS